MNTRKILLITSDSDLTSVVKISALTLTKLNCQVTIETATDAASAVELSRAENTDLVIVDGDEPDSAKLIADIRNENASKNRKIMLLHSGAVDRENIFRAGCDSIMDKSEFKRAVNNILVF